MTREERRKELVKEFWKANEEAEANDELSPKAKIFSQTPRDWEGWRNVTTRDMEEVEFDREKESAAEDSEFPKYNPDNDYFDTMEMMPGWGEDHVKKHQDQLTVREVLKFGRHTKPTKGGRQLSFSALVLVGNGNGSAGLGYGKALTIPDAVSAANKDAEKRLVHIKRFRGTSNVSRVKIKNRGCYVTKTPYSGEVGVKGCPMVQVMADAFGIGSLSVKITGPSTKNLASRAKTVFEALKRNRDPEAEAKAMGKMLFSPNKVWRRRDYKHVY